jgi:endothelin-converting enzyme/putative endopeptidase
VSWWTDADTRGFEARARCVEDQFEAYFIEPGVHHKGKLVLREAVGDLAGLRLALLALQRSMASRPVPTVDGFTPEQQFFIAAAQARAESIRPEALRKMIEEDTHPAPRFRVNGALSNLPEFHRAFSCAAGARMVRPPEARCAVW